MGQVRDHQPIVLDEFNGLWNRNDPDSTPKDHFQFCNNIRYLGAASFASRFGIGVSQDVLAPLSNIKRIYDYPTPSGNTLIMLAYDAGTNTGTIHHYIDAQTLYGPVLSIVGMTDFAFVPYAGRAYISPFSSFFPTLNPPAAPLLAALTAGIDLGIGTYKYAYTYLDVSGNETTASPLTTIITTAANQNVNLSGINVGGALVTARNIYRTVAGGTQLKLLTTIADNTTTVFADTVADGSLGANIPTVNTIITSALTVEKGLQNEFLYVYAGDGTSARKAAGAAMTGTMTVANGAAGHTDAGFHVFGLVSETVSGYLTPPGILTTFTTLGNFSISFGSIPTSGDPNVVKRHLVATKAITGYNGDPTGYTFYFVPNATIENNTDTFLNNISFYDADLLDDASHLLDNYSEIPAGAVLTLYRDQLILCTTFNEISIGLVSFPGEPEAISQIDGLFVVPPDGNPITNAQELRDVLYVTKRARTVSFSDNGDVPSTWPLTIIDNALGTSVHGIATVLDTGSSSVDFLLICTYQGVSVFNGRFITPELSWKIEGYWRAFDRNLFHFIQIVNSPIQKTIYIIMPNRTWLEGNYGNGLDPKKMRWSPQRAIVGMNTVSIWDIDEIIFGADIY